MKALGSSCADSELFLFLFVFEFGFCNLSFLGFFLMRFARSAFTNHWAINKNDIHLCWLASISDETIPSKMTDVSKIGQNGVHCELIIVIDYFLQGSSLFAFAATSWVRGVWEV